MPDWRRLIRERIAGAGLDPAREAEIVDEIAQHVEDRYRDLTARGVPDADAVRESLLEIDARERLVRDLARLPRVAPIPPVGAPEPRRFFAGLGQDLRYTLRLLLKSPGFTIAAIVTIALSTGPTIAALGVTNWLFLRPVPGIHEPSRLATVWVARWNAGGGSISPSWVSYEHLAQLNASLNALGGLAGIAGTDVTVSLDSAEPQVTPALLVTPNYFDVLGVEMQAGRPFRADEDSAPGGATVTILEAGLARSLFGEPAAAIGRAVRLNGQSFEVVGVVSDAFRGTSLTRRPAVWMTGRTRPRLDHMPATEWAFGPDRGPFWEFVARLSPGATFEQADAELRVLMRAFADTPGPGEKYRTIQPTLFPGVGVEPFSRQPMWEFVQLILWVGVALVTLGAANLANLFLFRASRRTQEAAVRRTLGASAARLIRLPMLEALVLALGGGVLGVALTIGVRAALDGVTIPVFGQLTVPMDWRLFAMAFGVSVVVGLLLSVLPARLAARADLAGALGRGGRTGTRLGGWLQTGLAATQVAISLGLLVGALLFVRTLHNLGAVELGFDARGVTELRVALRPQGYVGPRVIQFHRDLLARLEAEPVVEAASLVLAWPFSGFSRSALIHLPGQDPKTAGVRVVANDVSPGYFRTLGLSLLAGRTFTEAEAFTAGSEPGVVLGETAARQFFGAEPAVGRLITFAAVMGAPSHDVPVIGVVRDARWISFDKPELLIYRPIGSDGFISAVLVRSSRSTDEVMRVARAAVRALDASVPVRMGTLQAVIAERMNAQRLRAWTLGVLAVIGFLLAAVGIHGLVSQTVAERSREFGIRRAVGAGSAQVAGLVLRYGIRVVAIGVPLGLIAAALASGLVRGLLFGITPLEPWVYGCAAISLAVIVVVACLAPARRAVRVNPVEVLRGE